MHVKTGLLYPVQRLKLLKEYLYNDALPEFFKKKNVSTLTVKELFDFVTDATITEDNIDLYLEKVMTLASERSTDDITEQQKVDEEVKTIQKPMTVS